jgi:hypothetical protein
MINGSSYKIMQFPILYLKICEFSMSFYQQYESTTIKTFLSVLIYLIKLFLQVCEVHTKYLLPFCAAWGIEERRVTWQQSSFFD